MSTWLVKKVLEDLRHKGTTFDNLRLRMLGEMSDHSGMQDMQDLYDHLHEAFLKALDYMLNPPCKHEGGWLAADYLDGSVFVYCSLCGEEDGLEKYGSP